MIDTVIQNYLALRDKKASLEAEHKRKIAEYNSMLESAEALFLAEMQKLGTTSMTVAGVGTAYQSSRTSAFIADWDAYVAFCKQQDDPFMYLDRRASKTAVDSYAAEHGDVPAGINYRRETVVNVRRA